MSSDASLTPDTPARAPLPDRGEPGVDVSVPPTAGPPAVPPTSVDDKTTVDDKKSKANPESAVRFTRAAALWSSLIVGLLILIVLLVFITQNTESVQVSFIAWHWSLPLGVQILLAAVLGALITVMAGTVRIYQLRRAAKKNLKAGL